VILREQIISQRVGNRSGLTGKTRSGRTQQRPQRRGRGSSGQGAAQRRRSPADYASSLLKLLLAIVGGVLLFTGYTVASSASLFQLRTVQIQGTERASPEAIQTIVRREVTSGVWQADLKHIGAELEKLIWVRSAIVTRVLPDGIRVRVTERVPRAVARLSSGRFAWVDDDAVMLGEMKPTDEMPPFFLRGWNEEQTDSARIENVDRVRRYLELRRLWDGTGLTERVSEVNLIDVRDVRAQLAGDDSQIEVRLGSQDLGTRLKQALDVLDEQRKTSRGSFISYVDLTQGKRAIVGFVSGTHAVSEQDLAGSKPVQQQVPTAESRNRRQDQETTAKRSGAQKEKDREKRERQASSRNRSR
jgi:cell division protein FtsQ